MKKLILISFALLLTGGIRAQQDAMLSQYMFNGLFLNPAYAGSHDYFSSTMTFRKQWVNFDGAPSTVTAAIDGPINNDKMGIGFILGHDIIGVTNQTDFSANYSYNVKLGNGKLAFGVRAGLSHYNARLNELVYWDEQDEIYQSNVQGKVIPRFGFGAYYYQEGKWYAGFSAPTIIAYDDDYTFGADLNKSSYLRRHYYLTGGYVFTLNDNFKLKPSALVKYLPSAPLQADINFSAMYKETVWLGVSFRSGDAVVGIIEYQANNRFRIGYAYDATFSSIRNYSAGSHEIMIGFDFGKEIASVKTPRYF